MSADTSRTATAYDLPPTPPQSTPMRKDLFVYISGPMTAKNGYTIEDNVTAGLRVYFELLKAGIPCFCPHLSGAFPTAWTLLEHKQWLAYDLAVIDRCTHVLMMDRWESSAGACIERDYAIKQGKTITSLAGILEQCGHQVYSTVQAER